MLRALLFDVDGTLAETEEGHRAAWNAAFAAHGLDWVWDEARYRDLLQIAGGRERLTAYAAGQLNAEAIAAIHLDKNARYRTAVAAGGVPPRPGVTALIAAARARGLQLGIATTTSRANVTALITGNYGAEACDWFSVWASAEDADAKKPNPAVYHVALARLGLPASDVLAIEDSRNGLLAAKAAGLRCLLSPSRYFARDDPSGADLVLGSLADRDPAALLDWW